MSLLCSSLAWKFSQSSNTGPIIYASRTHSQLKQVIKELKTTVYKDKVKLTIIGSRNHMCVNARVTSKKSYEIRYSCRRLTRKSQCRFKNNITSDAFLPGLTDIEELKAHGAASELCPYFLTRHDNILVKFFCFLCYL